MPLPPAAVGEKEPSARARHDAALVAAALQGQARAYEHLLGYYRAPVQGVVRKLVPHPDEAEDVAMEAFGKAFRHLGRYSPQFAFSTWLFRIATNCAIDCLRRRRLALGPQAAVVPLPDAGDDDLPVPDEALGPLEACIRQQRHEQVRRAVAQLPAKYAVLVERRYFAELSLEETAAELGQPLGTVKANLNRARGLLLVLLQGRMPHL